MTIRISLTVVLLALVFAAIGAGTAVGVMLWEPWGGGDGVERAEPQSSPTETGPTRAELDAERQREEDRLCLEAHQASADFRAAEEARAARQEEAAQGSGRGRIIGVILSVPDSIQDAIDRYCK